MNIVPSHIPDLLIIEPAVHADQRGFFMETWHAKKFADLGLDVSFVQDNQSRSSKGVLRGLHYQLRQPQGKLVRVSSGAVFDAAVDIRKGSPTFGQWVGIELSDQNHRQFYVPPGFAHGFCVLSETADFVYKCTDFYAPDDEYGIAWDDPGVAIQWPGADFQISDKDLGYKRLREMDQSLLPEYGADK